MGRTRSKRRSARRRGLGRAAVAFAAAALLLLGCGRPDDGADVNPEKGADAAFLNAALVRELTALDAYTGALPRLQGLAAGAARRFRGQEQEYADAITKAIRGLGAELDPEAEAEPVDLREARTEADLLALLYGLESELLASYEEASPRLNTDAPQALATALAVGHAQHLVVLRQALGLSAVNAAPEAFDGGEVPLPDVEPVPGGAGAGPGKE